MSHTHRQRTIQFGLILFGCLFIAVTRTGSVVNSQSSCVVPFMGTPPRYSWRQNENVTVRIDDAWSESERNAFQAGIEKWNQANNCSWVTFGDYKNSLLVDSRGCSSEDVIVGAALRGRPSAQ